MNQTVLQCYRTYVNELHHSLFDAAPVEQLMKDVYQAHRRKRFVAMYLLSLEKSEFDAYYARRFELNLDKLFNQLISGLTHNTETSPLKQLFVKTLCVNQDMVTEPVTSYEIKEIEKDLNAFSFYQRKKAFKAKKKDLLE
ncbi:MULTISPECIES: hypothetical protein [unclassified Exiguobacterium]|uniref:hypothetical protein n=1 Tax=unclassified Exiguobacterium TaxID=2644629 RepID=UPI001BE4EE43|nr:MULTISPECIES: hypothetical protein [unclassified Exiguobacterium]